MPDDDTELFYRTRSVKPVDRYTPEHVSKTKRFKRISRRPLMSTDLCLSVKSVRRAVWEHYHGHCYTGKCITDWCSQLVDVWSFQVAHNLARCLGGSSTVDNLVPMCPECNGSMGTLSLKEWNNVGGQGNSTVPPTFTTTEITETSFQGRKRRRET